MTTGRANFLLKIGILILLAAWCAQAQTRRAVLVGINTYRPDVRKVEESGQSVKAPGRGEWVNLEGSLNDVESMRALLVTRFGFEQKDIHVVTEAEATHENILKAIQMYLADPAKPGDVSVFYYAGHGSQMKNSKSWKQDQLDETIVPADSYLGTMDVRDKEFARAFMKVLGAGARMVAIFDSCHSGAVTRGISRFNRLRSLPPDPRDAADAYSGPFPEKNGALVLAAAQDTESAAEGRDDNGVEHGAFTAALTRVLATAPVNEPAERIFEQTLAVMRGDGANQVPVISGKEELLQGALFGASAAVGSDFGGLRLPVISVDGEQVELVGGAALGFGVGSELVAAKRAGAGGAASGRGLRLRVTEEKPGKCVAKVVAGSAEGVKAGALFVVDKWVAADNGMLKVWIPPMNLSMAEVEKMANAVEALAASKSVTVVSDPYEESPSHIVWWNGEQWELSAQAGQNARGARVLGRETDLSVVARTLPHDSKLFVDLPLPRDAAEMMKQMEGGRSPIRVVKSMEDANYLLIGRTTERQVKYAWLLSGATKTRSEAVAETENKNGPEQSEMLRASSSLPSVTKWVAAQYTAESFTQAATSLADLAGSLARINGWLMLDAPPDDGSFPYKLAIVESAHPDAAVSKTYGDGRYYGLELHGEAKDLGPYLQARRVYVFVIDSDGNGSPLFPPIEYGDVQNVFPRAGEGSDVPVRIPLGTPKLFQAAEPFGTDTYFMLTTSPEDTISLSSLKWQGVRGGERGSGSPLDQLLSSVGARGAKPAAPASWSLTRLAIESAPSP